MRRHPSRLLLWCAAILAVQPLDVDRLVSEADVIFLALPEAASAELAPALLERGARVIDLSGAFRIRNASDRQRWYPATAVLPEGTVYGLTEGHQAEIRNARLVSNPGCYPTAALLALEPLHQAGLLTGPVVVDAKSGVSGAGKTPSERTHFSENHGSVAAYAVFQHRHTAEIEQELGANVTFVPHLVPLDRGILETIYGSLNPGTTEQQVADAFTAAYADAPFVRLTGGALPEIKHVAHTNFCDIGWKVDTERNRIVLVSIIDNLLKGAAGSAVQNLNVMLGLDSRTQREEGGPGTEARWRAPRAATGSGQHRQGDRPAVAACVARRRARRRSRDRRRAQYGRHPEAAG